MRETEADSRPRRSYFKMDCRKLMRPDVLERAKEAWQAHPRWAKDSRKKWTLALGRIRRLLMDVRDEEKRREEEGQILEEEVENARRRIEHDQSFKYLGVATSSPIDEKTITDEIVQKLMRKLKHWSNRLLSWPAKTILLRHVLAATPLYQLMSVGLCEYYMFSYIQYT
ncbi:hypothetical protein R1sor_004997 [Riccia sorocarpa]|uniref:Uncharacterized protein n=1 Tax=Riccia sorocarpa TaxID=122646 RepID=A0ABD3HMK1_9MARC